MLSAFMQVGQIKACGIVSKEGLLINSRAPPDVDARIFSALCSAIMVAAGDKAIFNALTEPDAQLGLILF